MESSSGNDLCKERSSAITRPAPLYSGSGVGLLVRCVPQRLRLISVANGNVIISLSADYADYAKCNLRNLWMSVPPMRTVHSTKLADWAYRINLAAIFFDLTNSFNSFTTGCGLKKTKTLAFGMKTILSPNSDGDFRCMVTGWILTHMFSVTS